MSFRSANPTAPLEAIPTITASSRRSVGPKSVSATASASQPAPPLPANPGSGTIAGRKRKNPER